MSDKLEAIPADQSTACAGAHYNENTYGAAVFSTPTKPQISVFFVFNLCNQLTWSNLIILKWKEEVCQMWSKYFTN